MAETDTQSEHSQASEEAYYWVREFVRYGMRIGHAETLAFQPGSDRHAIRDVLERGCDPQTAFLIFSS